MSIDLSTRYLGLHLESPLVISACPLTGNPDSLAALQDAGASAAVLPSLFEEQIQHVELELARLHDSQIDMAAESLSYFPELDTYNLGMGKGEHRYTAKSRPACDLLHLAISWGASRTMLSQSLYVVVVA